MNLNYYVANRSALINYGFEKTSVGYVYKQKINRTLLAVLTWLPKENDLLVEVVDSETNERFTPYYVKGIRSTFVKAIDAKLEKLISEIITNCFKKDDLEAQLITYCQEKYFTKVDNPWTKWPTYKTLKADNNKWYALFLNCQWKQLDLTNPSTELVYLLNVKAKPQTMTSLVDNKNYFQAYHMNKAKWISIVLNHQSDLEMIKKLIDESHQLVINQN